MPSVPMMPISVGTINLSRIDFLLRTVKLVLADHFGGLMLFTVDLNENMKFIIYLCLHKFWFCDWRSLILR